MPNNETESLLIRKQLIECKYCNTHFVISLSKKRFCKCPSCEKKAKHLSMGQCQVLDNKRVLADFEHKGSFIIEVYYSVDKRKEWEINPVSRVKPHKHKVIPSKQKHKGDLDDN